MAAIDDAALAQALLERGLINEVQLAEAREEADSQGINVVQALLGLGYVNAGEIATTAQTVQPEEPTDDPLPAPPVSSPPSRGKPSTRIHSLDDYEIEPAAIRSLPRALAEQHQMLPLSISEERLLLGMADPGDVMAIDAARIRSGKRVEPVALEPEELRKAIEKHYSAVARASSAVIHQARDLTASAATIAESGTLDAETIGMLDQAPIVRVVETLVRDAVRQKASDIHVEPRHDRVQVRYRLDGALQTHANLPKDMQALVTSRLKILSDIDIAESRLPHSGRFEFVMDDRPVDLRVSTVPTFWGEKVVLRLLDKSNLYVSLGQLGFNPAMQEQFETLLRLPQGLILVTGPTGSGKSTTLYASLHTINDESKNITTVEDPIEYEVEGLNQIQVHQRIGLDFAQCLREILRQDPDVILVGEVRDLETAQMTFRAAMTGHLVLSTLHTNDAPSAATRLVDMGVPAYLVGSSLTGVLAQRLVRRICTQCRAPHTPTSEELRALGLSEDKGEKMRFFWGRGCRNCRNTGYSGRIAIYELMIMNNEVRRALVAGEDASVLRKVALQTGMKPLRFDGLNKIHQGLTTAQEVISVTFAPEMQE
jgi:type IV pilus assembly protein PilB